MTRIGTSVSCFVYRQALRHGRTQRLRPLLVIREPVQKLLRHEPVLSAHPPVKEATEDDEEKYPGAASDERRTDACDEASGIHRVPDIAVWTRCYHQFLSFLGGAVWLQFLFWDCRAQTRMAMLPAQRENDAEATDNSICGRVEDAGDR